MYRKPIVCTVPVPNNATHTWLCLMTDLDMVIVQTNWEVLELRLLLRTKRSRSGMTEYTAPAININRFMDNIDLVLYIIHVLIILDVITYDIKSETARD